MIKMSTLLSEDMVDVDKLFSDERYLDKIATQMGYNVDFNSVFWKMKYMPILYHCTEPDRWEMIKVEGLKAMNGSRGLSNRSVGKSIFTTMEELEVPFFKSYYGDCVLAINAQAMKNDHFTPEVSRELDWDRASKLEFIMRKMGKEAEADQFIESSDQNTSGTVILYSDIPLKYVSLTNL
jgi:hypothetical protein